MIRAAVFFAGFLLSQGTDVSHCALNGARAVDDLLDSATYIWASVQRCQTPGAAAPNNHGNTILCAMDVSSAIEAVNAMVNVILKGVEKCGHLDGKHHKCGLAVGVLTKTFAGVAASSAGVTAKCPNALNGNKALTYLMPSMAAGGGAGAAAVTSGQSALASAAQQASFAQCLVNVKDVTVNLFKATKRLTTVKENCNGEHPEHCEHNALKIVASFAAMGEYLAGAVGRCTAQTVANDKLKGDAQCASEAMSLIRHLHRLASAGLDMKKHCNEGEERLYALENGEEVDMQSGTGSSVTLALAALLPITAVLAFVGGSRFAKSRQDFGSLASEE